MIKLRRSFFVLVFALASCTRPETPIPFQAQKPMFQFERDAVEELEIQKNDPLTGDQWSVTMRPNGRGDSAIWMITSSGSKAMVDKQADSNLIRHFLDTLQTLVYEGPAPKGPLSSYGLEPPQFSIRFRVEGKSYEFSIGATNPRGSAEADSVRYAQVASVDPILIVHGASMQMLGYFKSLEMIRQKTVVTFHADDIDEFTVKKAGELKLYAQRQADGWANRQQKMLRPAVSARYEDLNHLRIREFVDNEEASLDLSRKVANAPLYEATFTERKGRTTTLKIGAVDGNLVGTISGRDSAAFLLHTESARIFEDLSSSNSKRKQ